MKHFPCGEGPKNNEILGERTMKWPLTPTLDTLSIIQVIGISVRRVSVHFSVPSSETNTDYWQSPRLLNSPSRTGSRFCCYVAESVGSVLLFLLLLYSTLYTIIIAANKNTSHSCQQHTTDRTDRRPPQLGSTTLSLRTEQNNGIMSHPTHLQDKIWLSLEVISDRFSATYAVW